MIIIFYIYNYNNNNNNAAYDYFIIINYRRLPTHLAYFKHLIIVKVLVLNNAVCCF